MSVCVHGGGEGVAGHGERRGKRQRRERETERDRVITESSREAREARNAMAWTVDYIIKLTKLTKAQDQIQCGRAGSYFSHLTTECPPGPSTCRERGGGRACSVVRKITSYMRNYYLPQEQ